MEVLDEEEEGLHQLEIAFLALALEDDNQEPQVEEAYSPDAQVD